jgi:histone H3/H4
MADSTKEQDVSADEGDEDEDFQDAMYRHDAGDDEEDDEKNDDEDDESLEDHTDLPEDEEDELLSAKSQNTEEDLTSVASRKTDGTPDTKDKARKASASSSAKKGRTPSVAGLTIPFRTVKKAMKLDPDIPIVQNEAAIMTTFAVELFLKRLAKESFRNAKNRGRNTVRYEDVAEARTSNKALAFLEPLLP